MHFLTKICQLFITNGSHVFRKTVFCLTLGFIIKNFTHKNPAVIEKPMMLLLGFTAKLRMRTPT